MYSHFLLVCVSDKDTDYLNISQLKVKENESRVEEEEFDYYDYYENIDPVDTIGIGVEVNLHEGQQRPDENEDIYQNI